MALNPVDNQFVVENYPLALALTVEGLDAAEVAPHLQGVLPATNRDPDRLTTLVMTGVTAMSRGTAARMEQKGYTYPAAVISDTLRSADITHVSNEVPFIDGCKVNNTFMNLVLCSDYPVLANAGSNWYGHRRAERQPCQRFWAQGRSGIPGILS